MSNVVYPDFPKPDLQWIELLKEEDFLIGTDPYNAVFERTGEQKTNIINLLEQKAKDLKVLSAFKRKLKEYQQMWVSSLKKQGSNIIDFTDCPLKGLSCGEWICKDTGIYRHSINNFDVIRVDACSHPILPVERLVNIDDDTEKVKLAFFKDGYWQNIVVQKSIIASKTAIIILADRGIEVNTGNAPELVKYLADVIALNMQEIPKYRSIGRLGWIDSEFAPYAKDIKYDGDLDYQSLYESVKEKGNYDAWKERMIELRKNKIIKIIMGASIASPIISRIGALPFVLNLWGGTGVGKTVACMCAMSIWGNPEQGKLFLSMNNTKNYFARTSAFLHNIPFYGDEFQIVKSHWDSLDNLIMFLTEGIDRGKAKASGGTESIKVWKNSFLFTGEEPIAKSNAGGGIKNRIIEIEVKDKLLDDGNTIVNFVSENYGFAGKEIIDMINQSDAKFLYNTYFKEIMKKSDTTEKQAMAMALILTGDFFADCIFKDGKLEVDDILEFLPNKKEVDLPERARQWTFNWISKNIKRFNAESNQGEVWGKLDESFCMINKDVLLENLSIAGFDYTACASKWAERGQIVRNSQSKNIHQTKVFGIKASYIRLVIDEDLVIKDDE